MHLCVIHVDSENEEPSAIASSDEDEDVQVGDRYKNLRWNGIFFLKVM